MLVCFLKVLATGVGRGGGGHEMFPFIHRDIPCRIDEIRLGADLFRSTHLRRTFLRFSHISSTL